MFGIGVGPALILAVVLAETVFGIPLTEAAPAAAVIMCVAAYGVSRDTRLLSLGFAVVTFATARLLITFGTSSLEGQGQQPPEWLQAVASALTSNGVVITVSAIAFILAMLMGIFGPLRHVRKVDDLLRDRDSK